MAKNRKPIAYRVRVLKGGKWWTYPFVDGPPKEIRKKFAKYEIKSIRASMWKPVTNS